MIRVRQKDGSTRTFFAADFWRQLFLSEAGGAVGERTPTAASLAMEGATSEAQAEIRALILSEGGDFLKIATADGFGNIEPEVPDLSDGAERRENRF
jgi:hypothetical protein